jgi:hypothetical protein
MARITMVTRTITTTEVEVLCMNIETVQVETKTVTLLGAYSSDDIMLKKVKEQLESETLKPVHIQSTKEIETLYGMTEADFINIAKALPPRKGLVDNSEAQPDIEEPEASVPEDKQNSKKQK